MKVRSTTIVAVRTKDGCAIAGDGQVTIGERTIMKHHAKKVRYLYNNTVMAGFAGSVADALALFERFEAKLQEYHGQLTRAAVEMAKEWRMDRALRRLEAMMIVMDKSQTLIISGTGDVIEPDDGVAAIGSGGPYALAAAKALVQHTDLPADAIVKEAMAIAASICVFTNAHITVLTL